MSATTTRRAGLARPGVAIAATAFLLLATAGAFGLFEPTETRYAEVAREMRASGDYVIPTLDGIPHFHKPVLAYWAVAAGFALAGENVWGARVPSTLAAIAMLGLVPLLVRRRFASLAIPPATAVWALGSSILFFALGRSVATDPWLALSVACFWAWAPSPWALAALGAGFFAKGPVAFVPTLLVILVVAALGRDRAPLRLLGPAWGWSLFALIGLPWYLLAILRTPGLLHYLLVNQIWERYTTHVHHRAGPAWYFVAVLAGGSMPWLAAMAAGLTRLTRTRALAESRLLLGWLLIPLVFFSFSGSKLPAYLLPCFPAVALIAALGFEHGGGAVRWGTAALLAATALAGWIIGPALFARAIGLHAVPPAALPPAAHMAFVTMLWAASWFARGRAGGGGLLALFGWALLVVAAAPYEAPLGSPRLLARLIAENRAPEEPLVEYAELNAGVPFYLRELLPLLEVPRETWWEDPAMRPSVVIGRDSLASLVSRRGRVWILGPAGRMQALADTLGLSFEPTASWRRSVLGFLSR